MKPEKDLYRIPSESPLQESLRIADELHYTPETQPEAFAIVGQIQNRLAHYRAKTHRPSKNRLFALQLRPFVGVKKTSVEELREREATIGGTLHARASDTVRQRFWYHDNNDWFFETTNSQRQTTVIHIEATPTSLHKRSNGNDVPFQQGEPELFIESAIKYEEKLLETLYSAEDQRAA